MSKGRAHRLATTFFVVVALLFSQLALAKYVCPSATAESEETAVMKMAPGEPCDGMDMVSGKPMDQEHPLLCHQYCVSAPQSLDGVQVPAVSLPAVVQVFVVPLLQVAGADESVVFAEAGEERPPPDPLFLSTLRLRV